MKRFMHASIGVLALAAAFQLGAATVLADAITMLPYGSSGIRYHVFDYGHVDDIPDSLFAVDLDDSDWNSGAAPFGTSDSACAVSVNTEWASTDRAIVARVWVEIPVDATNVWGVGRYSHHFNFWVNGHLCCSSYAYPVCPWHQSYTCGPLSSWWSEGLNLIAVGAMTSAVNWRYLDFTVQGLTTTAVADPSRSVCTWSCVKALYR